MGNFYQRLLRLIVWLAERSPDIDIDIGVIKIGHRHLCHCHCSRCNPSSEQGEIKVMFVEQATHEPVPFSVAIAGIKDAEGNELGRDEVTVEVSTSDPAVLTADFDESTDKGEIQFGGVGESLFSLNVVDKDDPDDVLATYQVGFKLVSGDPASVESVAVSFEGISEVPPPEPDQTLPPVEGGGGEPAPPEGGEAPHPDQTLPGDLENPEINPLGKKNR